MSGNKSEPTIGVDIFKELINDMKNELNINLVNVNTKLDNITTRLNSQDLKINDLGQRVESLEKHLTYAEAAKTPPPTNTNTNTETNTSANTNKVVIKHKNDNLTLEEIMNRSRNIVGIFPNTIRRHRNEQK